MESAKERRERFRDEWGVSPKSVNNLRTMKTMNLGVQVVKFAHERAREERREAEMLQGGLGDAAIHENTAQAEKAKDNEKEVVDAAVENEKTEDDSFDLEAEFNAVEDLIFHSATKVINPEITRAMDEAEISIGCQVNLEGAFDDILFEEEDMDITQVVGSEEAAATSSDNMCVKKSVTFQPGKDDDHEEEPEDERQKSTSKLFRGPQTPYDARKSRLQAMNTPMAIKSISARAQMELAMLYEGLDDDEDNKGDSGARGRLSFE
jgi:hypothetical protein